MGVEHKFNIGDRVLYESDLLDEPVFVGTIEYLILSDVVAYGVRMDYDGKVYNFPEKVLRGLHE